jgi:hypothetical protein
MKTYILTGVSASQRQALAAANIVFHDWGNDVMVDETNLPLACSALGATYIEAPTDHEGLVMLTLTYASNIASKGTVTKQTPQSPPVDPKYAKSRANYIANCHVRLEKIREDAKKVVKANQRKMPPLQERFVALARAQQCSTDGRSRSTLEGQFAAEFERIASTPKVASLRVINGALLVYTDTLYLSSPGTSERQELGSFLIVIRTDGKGEPVRWFNRTRRVTGISREMHAPTVFKNGVACNTELKETLAELVAQFEFGVVVDLSIQFVETVEGELARFANRWPLA